MFIEKTNHPPNKARNKMSEQITYHPYGVLYLGGEFHSYKHFVPLALTGINGNSVYKHPAPLALTGINGDSIAAEQRNVYRTWKKYQ